MKSRWSNSLVARAAHIKGGQWLHLAVVVVGMERRLGRGVSISIVEGIQLPLIRGIVLVVVVGAVLVVGISTTAAGAGNRAAVHIRADSRCLSWHCAATIGTFCSCNTRVQCRAGSTQLVASYCTCNECKRVSRCTTPWWLCTHMHADRYSSSSFQACLSERALEEGVLVLCAFIYLPTCPTSLSVPSRSHHWGTPPQMGRLGGMLALHLHTKERKTTLVRMRQPHVPFHAAIQLPSNAVRKQELGFGCFPSRANAVSGHAVLCCAHAQSYCVHWENESFTACWAHLMCGVL